MRTLTEILEEQDRMDEQLRKDAEAFAIRLARQFVETAKRLESEEDAS